MLSCQPGAHLPYLCRLDQPPRVCLQFFDEGGQADFERARAVLAACENDPVLEVAVQTRIRTEIVEFGYAVRARPLLASCSRSLDCWVE